MLVDFFIAGVQKSGTTALDSLLRGHSQIRMAKVKEVHFFDDDSVVWTMPDYSRLHEALDWNEPDVKIRGEATPIYTYWPNALQRIRTYNSAAKLIIGLRHPSFRAYSHWRMETERGAERLPFSAAISRSGRQRVAHAPYGVHRVFSYVERGFYADQIDQLLSLFPRYQLFFYRTDRLWDDTSGVLDSIQDFLEVPRQLEVNRQYISRVTGAPSHSLELPAMSNDDRAYLDNLFADDIVRSSERIGLNLHDWLDPLYVEPMGNRGV